MITYKWRNGLPFVNDSYGGLNLPQVYCTPVSSSSKSLEVMFTDDAIFHKRKQGLFQLLVLLENLADVKAIRKSLLAIESLSSQTFLPEEATFMFQKPEAENVPTDIGSDVFRIATAEEFTATESLCKNRPAPQYYDMYRMKKVLHDKTFVIVRPDRFLYAACDTADQLYGICAGMQQTLGLE